MPRLIRERRGVSLPELLIVMLIMGIIGTATMRVFVKQQQVYKDARKQATMQRELRLTGSSLPQEMRATSSSGDDIIDAQENSISFNANIGSSIACEITGAGNQVVLPPLLGAELILTNWYTQPVASDSVFIYDDGPLAGSEDDAWIRRGIATFTNIGTTACMGVPFTSPALDAGKNRWSLTVTGGPLPATVQVGTVLRFARPVRYSLYQSGVSKEWYMGYEERLNNSWTTIEPVGGPFRPYLAGDGTETGMQLRYFDSLGVRLTTNDSTSRQRISRVDVYLRTNAGEAAVTERRPNLVKDSLMLRVAVRNFK